ncbi:hypothetical protein ASPWEDRAFT_535722 [Aspergillus wentii DTO 134E9]|uniref:Uncharacterized protein n=1 Tax=Aspergillus wentii DTO 134E9 TaxID=1073089 RepID=A0A1L9RMQ0_ASPWE|nr:uncharacterized protein ASPWEDRAFT_535722 [Aspergillus wentii DTO 134E9]OJJ36098.1 hypothetical protein ASPWEDRAFT_535722 [Aspergillus wentii DTO 134E9]
MTTPHIFMSVYSIDGEMQHGKRKGTTSLRMVLSIGEISSKQWQRQHMSRTCFRLLRCTEPAMTRSDRSTVLVSIYGGQMRDVVLFGRESCWDGIRKCRLSWI